MATLRELRIKARKLGATNVREMDEDELKEYIDEHAGKNGKSGRKAKRGRPAKKATARKARRVVEDDYDDEDEDEEIEETPRKRGRPKGSTNKAKTTKRGPGRPKGSGKKAATKTSSRSTGKVGRPVGSGTGTRVTLKDRINWNKRFDFREGSTAQYILTQVRKSAAKYDDTDDIREDVIEKLENKLGKIDELTFINRSTNRAHKGDKAYSMLRYRVARTMLDYAIETGQHDGSGNGGSTTKAPAKRGPGRPPKTAGKRGPGRPRKVVEDDDEDEDEAPRRRGRPKGSKNKTTAKRGPGRPKGTTNKVKRGPGRPKGTTNKKRGPGRPKGSKNKARR